ncbi:hypothetical protein BHY07_02320 [Bacillus subtilis subsp. subtilis]|nr:hypothetical protein QU35_02320 [Bacillus subtilis subsp. subtilis str. 168]AIY95992.1 hypothetical protein QX56_02320 [Bacillus subtilis]AJE93082.1 hypothetical protein RP72_02320 [Bacillus subtilis subsp. subtilis]AKC45933.1 hypothetical protein O7A_02320 [Bacillus subtilis KCTC 1028 = ATCC 6051a]AOL28711.1 hypothetical protein BGM23_19835 [Bacillus sp. FJAT-14266]AOL32207.1 hypothetical protein BGM20_17090 [Alkalicoccobacillus gibsonii]
MQCKKNMEHDGTDNKAPCTFKKMMMKRCGAGFPPRFL